MRGGASAPSASERFWPRAAGASVSSAAAAAEAGEEAAVGAGGEAAAASAAEAAAVAAAAAAAAGTAAIEEEPGPSGETAPTLTVAGSPPDLRQAMTVRAWEPGARSVLPTTS